MTNEEILKLFHSEKTLTQIRKEVGIRYNIIADLWKQEYGEEAFNERKRLRYRQSKLKDNNPMKGKYKREHHNYKDTDRISSRKGYSRVRAPEWYEGSTWMGYVDEHVIVYCETRDLKKLPEGFVVHHLDMVKTNNSPDNLVMLTNSDHRLLHAWIDRVSRAVVQRLSGNGVEE